MIVKATFNSVRLAGLAACLLVACGGESSSAGLGPDSAGRSPGASGAPAAAAGGAPATSEPSAFVVASRIWDDTSITSYFNVVPSLDRGTFVDLDGALEVAGAAKLYAVKGAGWFAVGGGEAPTITRYTLDDAGGLVAGQTISMLGYGVESLWDHLYVVSETKVYYADRDNAQLIVINPQEMEIEGVVELPETSRAGYLALYGYTPLVREGKLMFTVGWFDWSETDSVLGETGLVVLDTETDTLERFDVDDRCGGITTGVVTDSGDAYFVSSALAAAAYRLGRLTTEPCALRVNAGDDAFDPSYAPKLAGLVGSDIVGEPVPGGGEAMFLRVFDQGESTFTQMNATWDLTAQSVWDWWRWDLESGKAELVEELAASKSDGVWFEVDGRIYATEASADYSQTTLIELTAEGGPRNALTAPGFVHRVARAR